MKSVLRYTAAAAALATVGFASAASAATDDAQVTAEILNTLQVVAVTGDDTLDFGKIADAGLTGTSTVAVSNAGIRACGSNLACSGTVNAPSFTITGLTGSSVAVSFQSPTVPLTLAGVVPSGMTGTMSVGSFNTNLASNPLTLTTGTATFAVGATLTVNPLQAPGIYTGAVNVNVLYN